MRTFEVVSNDSKLDDLYFVSIKKMREHLDDLEKQFGKNLFLRYDVGYSNISVEVLKPITEKQIAKRKKIGSLRTLQE